MIPAPALIAMVAALVGAPAAATAFEVVQVVEPTVALPVDKPWEVAIDVVVKPGYHVQANPAAYPELVATALTLPPAPGVAVGKPRYPAPKRLRLEGSVINCSSMTGGSGSSFRSRAMRRTPRRSACTAACAIRDATTCAASFHARSRSS